MNTMDKIKLLVERHGSHQAVAKRLGITPRRLSQIKRAGRASGPLAVLLDELTSRPTDCNVSEKVSQCN